MKNDQLTCDPARIELYLGQQLTDDEQAAFEFHLDDCDDCRQRLEAAAASDDIWTEVQESLAAEPLDLSHSRADAMTDSATGDVPFSHGTVLGLLAPTDDDRMIGRLGTYEVVGVIGSGGMGVVLKAFDVPLNRFVAIKVLAPHLGSSGAARKRFSREAQAAAAVVHDNVIEIHGVDNLQGLPYLVMPYVPGPSLQRRLDDDGSLALVEILRIGVQAASGLAAAHAQGLVHRDVKPANILLADGVERVKLTDFGLARAADDASLTKTGIIAGTPQYMSPEQARGDAVDQRSDLFSLGSVLYAMCTGRAPFRAETSYGVLRRITDAEPKPIQGINPNIPQWLCQIIVSLMSKQPDDRFESAAEVADLLEECLAHVQQPTVVALPQSRLSRCGRVDRFSNHNTINSSRRPPFNLLVAAGLAFAFLFASVLIVLELNKGTLQIESEAHNVPVHITQGDKVVEKLTVTRSGASVRIAAGQYVVEIAGGSDGTKIQHGTVTLRRGAREVVRIVRREETPDTKKNEYRSGSPIQRSTSDTPSRPIHGARDPRTGRVDLNPEWAGPVRRMLSTATAIEVTALGRQPFNLQIPASVQGKDSEKLIGVVVALVAEGSVSWKSHLKRVFVIGTDKQSAEIAETLLPAALDRLVRPSSAASRRAKVDSSFKQEDPRRLQSEADHVGSIAIENLLSGESHLFESARWFWELSRSLQQEADLREKVQELDNLAKERLTAGKSKEAEKLNLESRNLAASAEQVVAQRKADERQRDHTERVRAEAKQLADRLHILREEGREKEASEIEERLDTLLRHQDPDSFRVLDLGRRVIDARTRGRHDVADELEAERRSLLKALDKRYPRSTAVPGTDDLQTQANAPETLELSPAQLIGVWVGGTDSVSSTLSFESGGRFMIVSTSSQTGQVNGSGTWAIVDAEVIATYTYDGQTPVETKLALKIEAPTLLSFAGVTYFKQEVKTRPAQTEPNAPGR